MENELVSAIITTHNRAPGIVLRAVNSVLNQSYENMELIVVDDSDHNYPNRNGVEKAVTAASSDVKYVKHKECIGACAARNAGLSISAGNYVAFLDDDDEWAPTKIEEQMKGFTDADVAVVYCGCLDIDELQGYKAVRRVLFQKGDIFSSLLKSNYIGGTSNPLIRKECIVDVGGFDVEMQSAQDFDLWVRMAKKYESSVAWVGDSTPLITNNN